MKKINSLLFLLFVFTFCSLSAQTKDSYLLKSKHQKTAAWILLGGGTTLFIVGGIIASQGLADIFTLDPDKGSNTLGIGGVLAATGGAAMLGSIPFFIAASKNKYKAMQLTFINQPLPAIVKNMMGNTSVPSITLHLNL